MWLQIPFFLCVMFLGVICEYVLNNKNKMDRWSPLSSNVKSLIRTVFGIAFVFQKRTDLDCSNAAQHMRSFSAPVSLCNAIRLWCGLEIPHTRTLTFLSLSVTHTYALPLFLTPHQLQPTYPWHGQKPCKLNDSKAAWSTIWVGRYLCISTLN